MKKNVFVAFVLFLSGVVFGQIGITTEEPKATLDVGGQPENADVMDGIMAPRITGDQLNEKNYTEDQTGAILFVTSEVMSEPLNSQLEEVDGMGYYYFDGSKWQKMINLAQSKESFWGFQGNEPEEGGFIGTTNDEPLIFKSQDMLMGYSHSFVTFYGTNAGLNDKVMWSSGGFPGGGIMYATESTGIGSYSLEENTEGLSNTAVGSRTLRENTTGDSNTAVGAWSLSKNVLGNENTAVGAYSLNYNVNGEGNSAFGTSSLTFSRGDFNTAMGRGSVALNLTGSGNTALGYDSMYANQDGSYNLAMGYKAGYNTNGNNNILLGANTEAPNLSGDNQMVLGNEDIIYAGAPIALTIDSNEDNLDNIIDLTLGLDFINELQPREFDRPGGYHEYGFVAQEVKQVLVAAGVTDTDGIIISTGDLYQLRYNDLLAFIVKAIQDLDIKIDAAKAKTFSENSDSEISTLKESKEEMKLQINEQQSEIEMLKAENQMLKLKNEEMEQRIFQIENTLGLN